MRRLSILLIALGGLLVLGGLYTFDAYSHFTSLSMEGKIKFFTCEQIAGVPPGPVSQDPSHCIQSFLGRAPHLIGITITSLALEGVGILAILIGLNKNKEKILKTA